MQSVHICCSCEESLKDLPVEATIVLALSGQQYLAGKSGEEPHIPYPNLNLRTLPPELTSFLLRLTFLQRKKNNVSYIVL
jgi:hypothetical protein